MEAANEKGTTLQRVIKPPVVKSLVSMCASITSSRSDLASVDRLITLLDKTVSEMRPGTVLPEMKWMLLGKYQNSKDVIM